MTPPTNIPLCLFPSAHWFALCAKHPGINPQETYLKQTYRNRFDILGVNGRLSLTVPVEGQKGLKTPMKDIRITGTSWRKQHLATLRSSYGRAAYFDHYFERIEQCFLHTETFLFDLNLRALDTLQLCGIAMDVQIADEPWAYAPGDSSYLWEPAHSWPKLPSYPQVFSDRHPFSSGLSILDVIMNKGPLADSYIQQVINTPVE